MIDLVLRFRRLILAITILLTLVSGYGLTKLRFEFLRSMPLPENDPAVLANAAMADAEVQKRIAALGMDLPPKGQAAPAAFAAFHKSEVEKWYPIVKAAGVKPE